MLFALRQRQEHSHRRPPGADHGSCTGDAPRNSDGVIRSSCSVVICRPLTLQRSTWGVAESGRRQGFPHRSGSAVVGIGRYKISCERYAQHLQHRAALHNESERALESASVFGLKTRAQPFHWDLPFAHRGSSNFHCEETRGAWARARLLVATDATRSAVSTLLSSSVPKEGSVGTTQASSHSQVHDVGLLRICQSAGGDSLQCLQVRRDLFCTKHVLVALPHALLSIGNGSPMDAITCAPLISLTSWQESLARIAAQASPNQDLTSAVDERSLALTAQAALLTSKESVAFKGSLRIFLQGVKPRSQVVFECPTLGRLSMACGLRTAIIRALDMAHPRVSRPLLEHATRRVSLCRQTPELPQFRGTLEFRRSDQIGHLDTCSFDCLGVAPFQRVLRSYIVDSRYASGIDRQWLNRLGAALHTYDVELSPSTHPSTTARLKLTHSSPAKPLLALRTASSKVAFKRCRRPSVLTQSILSGAARDAQQTLITRHVGVLGERMPGERLRNSLKVGSTSISFSPTHFPFDVIRTTTAQTQTDLERSAPFLETDTTAAPSERDLGRGGPAVRRASFVSTPTTSHLRFDTLRRSSDTLNFMSPSDGLPSAGASLSSLGFLCNEISERRDLLVSRVPRHFSPPIFATRSVEVSRRSHRGSAVMSMPVSDRVSMPRRRLVSLQFLLDQGSILPLSRWSAPIAG
eukprot:TRINITY_DN9833_c0_g1_i1.p1 TRINITY_DN9833_c0_g1~~TRINITY_DN9833_c0_g1_i1.p1  ORF type:complete len:746 (+),score=72.92 TRINITY_DN9833_c0_g1_i1:158-2239(+)